MTLVTKATRNFFPSPDDSLHHIRVELFLPISFYKNTGCKIYYRAAGHSRGLGHTARESKLTQFLHTASIGL